MSAYSKSMNFHAGALNLGTGQPPTPTPSYSAGYRRPTKHFAAAGLSQQTPRGSKQVGGHYTGVGDLGGSGVALAGAGPVVAHPLTSCRPAHPSLMSRSRAADAVSAAAAAVAVARVARFRRRRVGCHAHGGEAAGEDIAYHDAAPTSRVATPGSLSPEARVVKDAAEERHGMQQGVPATVEKPLLLSAMQAIEGLLGRRLDNPFVDGSFAPVSEEVSVEGPLELLQGAVPTDFPDGLYVRNGPNPRFPTTSVEAPLLGRTAHHWFEGDGMLHAVHFQGGECSYRNRYVRTADFLRETTAGEALYRPTVQVTPPASLLNAAVNSQAFGASTKDVANTNVIYHGGRLMAITEGAAMPTMVSPKDLSTLGTFCFGQDKPLPSFTAHPRIDPATGELIFASYSFFEAQTGAPGVHMGVVAPDGSLKHWSHIPSADRNTLMHDVAITEHYTVITDFPLIIDPSQMFTEKGMLFFDEGASARIGIVPRYGNDVEKWFEVAPGYAFHLLNAYEDGDDIVVRGCRAGRMNLSFPWEDGKLDREGFVRDIFSGDQPSRLHEWRLHRSSGSVSERAIMSGFVDFPIVNPKVVGRRHRFGYCSAFELEPSIGPGLPVIGSIQKFTFAEDGQVTTECYQLPPHVSGQEVAFVARPGGVDEDDGWLLMFAHDESAERSELHVIDARNVSGPPCARIALPQRVPFGFHGTFVPRTAM